METQSEVFPSWTLSTKVLFEGIIYGMIILAVRSLIAFIAVLLEMTYSVPFIVVLMNWL